MKRLLIAVNALLLLLVLWSFAANCTRKKAAPVPKKPELRKKSAARKTPAPAPVPAPRAITPAEAQKLFTQADIFNPQRSPLAGIRGGGRQELTLLGTFQIGKVRGAIIRQRGIQRQLNPYLQQLFGPPGGFGGPPGMFPGGRGMNRSAGRGRSGNNANRGAGRERFTGMGVFGNARNPNNAGADLGTKQYIRVGESLSNGYMLSEVTRTRAVLVRGADKMELELQDPSKNLVSARRNNPPRLNTTQQLQQAQLVQQQMMMRMMMRMEGGGPGPGGGGNPRGGGGGGGGGPRMPRR